MAEESATPKPQPKWNLLGMYSDAHGFDNTASYINGLVKVLELFIVQ